MQPDPTGAGRTKAPAFQFYPQDFIVGTIAMTAEECGAYIRLLCYAWSHGGVPDDQLKLARIAGIDSARFGDVWLTVETKWTKRGPMLTNLRMEHVRKEQKEHREAKAEAGRKGAQARWSDSTPNATALPNQCEPDGKEMALQSSSSSSTPPSTSTPEEKPEIVNLFDFWKQTFGLNGSNKLTPKRRDKIKARLKDSTVDELKLAISGCKASEWHVEHDQVDLAQIFSDRGKVEKFIRKDKPDEPATTDEGEPFRKGRYTNFLN